MDSCACSKPTPQRESQGLKVNLGSNGLLHTQGLKVNLGFNGLLHLFLVCTNSDHLEQRPDWLGAYCQWARGCSPSKLNIFLQPITILPNNCHLNSYSWHLFLALPNNNESKANLQLIKSVATECCMHLQGEIWKTRVLLNNLVIDFFVQKILWIVQTYGRLYNPMENLCCFV